MNTAIYNNMSEKEIDQLQIAVRQVVRRKMKGRARNLPNDIIHGHKDLGGLGIDKLVDTINAARLKMLERFLHNHNMSHDIILGAIHPSGTCLLIYRPRGFSMILTRLSSLYGPRI